MTDTLYNLLVEPLSRVAFQQALIGGSLVAIVAAIIGCFVVLRRMSFLGDALSHAMLAGVTGGYLFTRLLFDSDAHAPAMIVGSLLAAVVTVGLIGLVKNLSRIKEDAAIGIIYTGIFSVGGILASVFHKYIHIDLFHFVAGQVLAVSDADMWFSAAVAVVVLSLVILFYRPLQLTTFDPIMAAAIGVPVVLVEYLLTLCTSLVVVSGVQMVGVILVVGMLISPAASAYLISDRLPRMLWLSALFGVTGVVGGLYLSMWLNVARGSALVLFLTVQFLVVFVVAPRYGLIAGWLRRAQMVPQPLVEDILRSIDKDPGQVTPLATIHSHVEARPEAIRRALRGMQRQGLIELEEAGLRLTEPGQHEARRLLRAHRLWETYLQHVGLPAGKLHEQAHKLEHVYDEQAVDYLEDKLGHPLTDPHGAEIPEDFVHIVPGHEISASFLRQGHRGVVRRVGPEVHDPRLQPGLKIEIGSRTDDDTRWTVILPDHSRVSLDHAAADDLLVEIHGS